MSTTDLCGYTTNWQHHSGAPPLLAGLAVRRLRLRLLAWLLGVAGVATDGVLPAAELSGLRGGDDASDAVAVTDRGVDAGVVEQPVLVAVPGRDCEGEDDAVVVAAAVGAERCAPDTVFVVVARRARGFT